MIAVFAVLGVIAGGLAAGQGSAAASATRNVEPGVTVTLADTQCKVGFLLHQGKKVYAAIPASCTALPNDEGKPSWGCGPSAKHPAEAMAPIGSSARIEGARRPATLVYDSFTQMQGMSKQVANRCFYNDLALLKLKPGDAKAARGRVPGTRAPTYVGHRAPANGSHLSDGSQSATAGSSAHHGWLYQLSSAPMFTASDVGTPFVQGNRLVGMLTQLPQSKDVVLQTDPGISNLQRALRFMRKAPRSAFHHLSFRHVKLLKPGRHA